MLHLLGRFVKGDLHDGREIFNLLKASLAQTSVVTKWLKSADSRIRFPRIVGIGTS